ncbi:MAG: acyl-CoA dehydrogenase [Gammaproteobacteria bacterium]|nr:MAG: acyl-CoA dehydrogenase [Gammaproteobacteria bacterium]
MPEYKAPQRDMMFVLNDIINVSELAELPGFEDATPDIVQGVVDEAAKIIENTIAPLNETGDREGCRFDNGMVTAPAGFKEAYQLYSESGWTGLDKSIDFGGQGLPYTLATAVSDMLCAGNDAFSLYPGLTNGACEALMEHGSQELQDTYLEKLTTGEWTGTMCLTEPQAGSDLSQVRTRAIDQNDGTYLIEGTKIFITGGEHDFVDNIIHLVLARLPDAPAGVKGISMFVVPKFMVDSDGNPGARNPVVCASIEEKMGIHGSSTCVMSFENATGYLIGNANEGLRYMFTMMNLARLMVGLQGLGVAERATQGAIEYAKERKQATAINGGETIIHHPDVRRMLMTMKALTEGCRMVAYDTAKHYDISKAHPDESVRKTANDRVELMTPICKAFATDVGCEVASLGVLVLGGAGYIRESGMEQYIRDAKIFCIYEGTNTIQALDLVGRKMKMNLPQTFIKEMINDLAAESGNDELGFIVEPMQAALNLLDKTTQWLTAAALEDPQNPAATAVEYLTMYSLVTHGHFWIKAARAALAKQDDDFYKGKLATARFFTNKILPRIYGLAPVIMAGSESVMTAEEDWL